METEKFELMLDEAQANAALEKGMLYADTFVNKNYLINLDRYPLVELAPAEKSDEYIRLYQIERIVYDVDENANDKLISVYSAYINRFNMGDATETADTIAHESRHCWQHERADNPQTGQDQQFKENFDNYIRPEDDFRAYKDQIVESDAREYAANVTNMIPELHLSPQDCVLGKSHLLRIPKMSFGVSTIISVLVFLPTPDLLSNQ